MADIIPLFTKETRTFSEDELRNMLPVVKRMTKNAMKELDDLQQQLDWVPRGEPLHTRLENESRELVERWVKKIEKLGLKATGVWEVDFKAREGHFFWQLNNDEELYSFCPEDEHATFMEDIFSPSPETKA